MKWFNKIEDNDAGELVADFNPMQLTQKPDPTTVATAAATLTKLRLQENELNAQLSEARTRMYQLCEGQAIPPAGHDLEVCALDRQLRACRAQIPQAEDLLRSLEGASRIPNSWAAKPQHDKLRMRVIRALEELRDALDAERRFRDSIDLTPDIIHAVYIDGVNPETLEAIIQGQKGYL